MTKLKKVLTGEYQPFAVFTAVMVLYHIMMQENPILDTLRYFAKALDQYTITEYLKMRYETWTSRLFIEFPVVYLARKIWLWKILDIVIMLLIVYSLSRIFNVLHDKKMNYLIVGMVLLYPFKDMGSTGWLSTCMFYTWVLCFGLISLIPVAKIWRKEKVHWYEWIICCGALLYAANMEQMCAVLTVAFFCAFVYFLVAEKKLNPLLLLQLLICLAQLYNIMTCPGNDARTGEEIATGIQDFKMLTSVDKLYLGFGDAIVKFLDYNMLLMVFTILLFVLILLKHKRTDYCIIAAIPVFMTVRIGDLGSFAQNFLGFFDTDYQMSVETYMSGNGYLMLGFKFLFVLCLELELVILCENYLEWLFLTLVLGMGLASRVVMGFSPTLYSSADRTFLYLYFCMIFTAVYFIIKNRQLFTEHKKAAFALETAFGIVVVINVMNTLSYIAVWV